jgi:hypothetical protein
MRSSTLGAAATRHAGGGALTAGAMDQFVTARQPWNAYIAQATREDAEPYPTKLNPAPMYRGADRGMEGWLFKESVQLHYRRYPDEHILANMGRWRAGDTVDDIAMQQFRGAQPFVLDVEDELGFKSPTPETYFKLNWKNPATFSKHLTRTGQFYPMHVNRINPEATVMVRRAAGIARFLGVYPQYGNPFWHRTQSDRPKAYQGEYDPTRAGVKQTVENFAYNWLQTYRVRKMFQKAGQSGFDSRGAAERSQMGNLDQDKSKPSAYYEPTGTIENSPANATVPGLMSLRGLRRNPNLYPKASKRRMGYRNAVGSTKRL